MASWPKGQDEPGGPEEPKVKNFESQSSPKFSDTKEP